jgi:hypothetical protein
MVAAMANDITIMGLCGETRIANKRTSCNHYTIVIAAPWLITYTLFSFK